MENGKDMEPGFATELKKFASYGGLIIGALTWLDVRYMGSHKELLATMETHHMEVVALEKDVIKLDKDVEYMKLDLDQLLANVAKQDNTDNQSHRTSRHTAVLFALPPKEEYDKSKVQYISAL